MKTSKMLAAAALAVLAAAGAAHAEEYEGVLQFNSTLSRAAVAAEARATAHAPDPFAEGATAGVQPAMVSATTRYAVRGEAVRTAHAPDQNVQAGSRGDQRFFAGIAPSTAVGSARQLQIYGAQ